MGKAKDYTLGWVAGDEVPTSFLGVLVSLISAHGPELAWCRTGPVLYLGRNLVARMFREQKRKTSSLVIVDTDMIFGPAEVEALLEHPEPVVSGVYVDSEGDLVTEGCGFLRVDREVFGALGEYPFDPMLAGDGEMTGEDVAFRKRVEAAGFEIAVDRDIRLGHVKQVMLWPDGSEQPQRNAAVSLIGRAVPMAPAPAQSFARLREPDGKKEV